MNTFRTFLISTAIITLLCMPFAYQAGAVPGPKVSEVSATSKGNKHNLSAKARVYNTTSYTFPNPNTYKATDDLTGNPKGQQICIFCHTPHSANVEGGAPLWNRKFSTETFSRYSSQTLEIRKTPATRGLAGYNTPAWQPDGSSKLCLSCHDGVATGTGDSKPHGLGDVLNGGPIIMSGGDFIAINKFASFNPTTNKMKTGHHPVSFVYDANVIIAINNVKTGEYRASNLPTVVKLDRNNKMQCTTCHNAHQNQTDDDLCYLDTDNITTGTCNTTNYTRKVTPFWVNGGTGVAATDRDNVCKSCHQLVTPSSPNPLP